MCSHKFLPISFQRVPQVLNVLSIASHFVPYSLPNVVVVVLEPTYIVGGDLQLSYWFGWRAIVLNWGVSKAFELFDDGPIKEALGNKNFWTWEGTSN
jgi:hypothetical protein